MVSDKSATETKVQKNLFVSPETAETIEKLSQEWYGSKKKQGMAVERLVSLHASDDMVGMIEDIHEVIVDGKGASSADARATHTQTQSDYNDVSSNTSDNEDTLDKLSSIAEAGESLSDDVDLSIIKGARSVDKPAIVRARLRGSAQDGWAKSDIMALLRKEAGYSKEGARNLAEETMWEMVDSPLADSDEWVSKRVDEDLAEHRLQNDPDYSTKKAYRRAMTSLNDYVGDVPADIMTDVAYIDDQAVAQDMQTVLRAIDHTRQHPRHNAHKARCAATMGHIIDQLGDDLLNTPIDDNGTTLRDDVSSMLS